MAQFSWMRQENTLAEREAFIKELQGEAKIAYTVRA